MPELFSSIEEAIKHNDTTTLKDLLNQKDVDPNLRGISERTPLHIAAIYGKLEVIKFLIENYQVDINARDIDDKTPLHEAIHHYLIDQLAKMDDSSSSRATFLDSDPLLIPRVPPQNSTIDLHKTYENYKNVVLYLLNCEGIEVNTSDLAISETPLHTASETGDVELVQLLIEKHNIEPNVKDNLGQTPLHEAIRSLGCKNIGLGYEPKKQVVLYLLNREGIEVNTSVSSEGETPLHKAAEIGDLDIAKKLVDLGANIEAKAGILGSYIKSPYLSATIYGHHKMIEFLESNGAKPTKLDDDATTAEDIVNNEGFYRLCDYIINQKNSSREKTEIDQSEPQQKQVLAFESTSSGSSDSIADDENAPLIGENGGNSES